MKHIRVVWKEPVAYSKKPFAYRGKRIYHCGEGWAVQGDDNIYRTGEIAMNAVDKALGGVGTKGPAKRRAGGEIDIIGKISDCGKGRAL